METVNLKVWYATLHPVLRMQLNYLKLVYNETSLRTDLNKICEFCIANGADEKQVFEFRDECISKGFAK